ncbi:hypothetical protein ACVW00_002427 [Marmoricola sp. URHA0025 HA25]
MSYPPPPGPDGADATPPPPPAQPPTPPYGAPPPAPPYGGPPPGYPPAPGGYYGQPMPRGNQKALWSMILGILSLICCGVITGVVAIVLSQQAKREIAASGGMQTGAGQAQAGFILGIIGIALTVIGLIAFAGSGSFS